MPGSSLWLLPPPAHPLHAALTALITSTLPARFPRESASSPSVSPHFFPPHVTLTSEVEPSRYSADPQAWLDRMVGRWLAGDGDSHVVKVRFGEIATQDVFFRRCFIRVGFERVRAWLGWPGMGGLWRCGWGAMFGEETERWLEWWRREYGPHVSLIYGDVPIADEVLHEVTRVVREAGIRLPKAGSDGIEEGNSWNGWDGGVVWLVPTDKPIAEWKPIATREL
ncbi:hypothetical protein MMYC01_204088 [Madurella mycetomatis]|uniref:2',3'-cyclic-nucleotide 3'-phosphodiesterase n=1 Tax=Madurella mycetomatis TaxID=100816 RepID=A0A175WBY1_9PEZI|nr:hypothetical protein MMYC01_204088 [Madurella mycetomatis]